jgi:hypothetical protein
MNDFLDLAAPGRSNDEKSGPARKSHFMEKKFLQAMKKVLTCLISAFNLYKVPIW